VFDNPHIMNLGRIRLCRANGVELAPSEIAGLDRTLVVWHANLGLSDRR
jgi:hypothetical protein